MASSKASMISLLKNVSAISRHPLGAASWRIGKPAFERSRNYCDFSELKVQTEVRKTLRKNQFIEHFRPHCSVVANEMKEPYICQRYCLRGCHKQPNDLPELADGPEFPNPRMHPTRKRKQKHYPHGVKGCNGKMKKDSSHPGGEPSPSKSSLPEKVPPAPRQREQKRVRTQDSNEEWRQHVSQSSGKRIRETRTVTIDEERKIGMQIVEEEATPLRHAALMRTPPLQLQQARQQQLCSPPVSPLPWSDALAWKHCGLWAAFTHTGRRAVVTNVLHGGGVNC